MLLPTHVLLRLSNLTKQYCTNSRRVTALDGVSFDLHRGEVMSLLGVNGAGKTTLSTILASLHPPTVGDVIYAKGSIYSDPVAYRRIVGYCPQAPNFDFGSTIKDILYFAARLYGLGTHAIAEKIDLLVEQFALQNYLNMTPRELSGGYKQRVMIARTLLHDPQLIILDEPTVGMDPQVRYQLWSVIKQLRAQGITILLTTHYLDEAELLSDRVCILNKGKIVLIDTPDNLKKAHHKGRLEDVFVALAESS